MIKQRPIIQNNFLKKRINFLLQMLQSAQLPNMSFIKKNTN